MAKLVMIEWVDSARPTPDWVHLSEYVKKSSIKCISVGFLVHDGKKVKALAQNMGDVKSKSNIQACGIIHIPACCISKISDLKVTE